MEETKDKPALTRKTSVTAANLISPVSLRTMTGVCHSANKKAIAWSAASGLVAYGSHTLVVVVDPVTMQVVQVLDRHRSSIVRLAWALAPTSKHPADRLMLASADATGHVAIWNVKSGEVKSLFQEGSRAVAEMTWLDGRQEHTAHLLAVLHPPNNFVLWDTSTGEKVWKKSYPDTLLGFDFDPFDPSKLAFRCSECVLFTDDFSVTRAPSSAGKKFYVLGPARGSPSRGGLESSTSASTPMRDFADEKSKAARTKIKRIMKEFVLGEGNSSPGGTSVALSECVQVLYHRTARNHLLLVYPKEVLILDLDIGQTVGVIGLDRSSPSISQAYASSQRDAIYLLYENGTVSLRTRKRLYNMASTPMEPIRNLSKSVSTTSIASLNASVDGVSVDNYSIMENVLEIVYEQKAYSESIRLSKSNKILGMATNPMTDKNLAVFTTDGRLVFVDLIANNGNHKPNQRPDFSLDDVLPASSSAGPQTVPALKLSTCGILSGLLAPPFIIRMCPPLTMKNINDYVPLMAIGAHNGNIQIANVSTGKIERDFAVHTHPVRGVEWTGLTSVLSHAHQTLSGNNASLVRNELILTDIQTGRTKSLRSNRQEEPPIDMLRVSHLKQYFIVAFSGAPFELWDLQNLTLLRTMPKKFPPITALDWSPLHNLKSLKKKLQESAAAEGSNSDNKESSSVPTQPLIAKEHFVFTDPEGQLYHFSVEGNAIRDGTKVPAETSLSTITCIAWKSDHIVRGDSDGHINVWDVRTRTSRNIATNRGAIKKLRFAPGRGNLKLLVQNPDSISIWDVKECELVNELRSPKDITKVIDIEWAASDRAVLATIEGCVRIMGLGLSASTSAMYDYTLEQSMSCHPLLPNKARTNFHLMLHHQPWKASYSLDKLDIDGFSATEKEYLSSQLDLIPEHVKNYLKKPALKGVQRCLLASQICGLSWESQFWRVAEAVLLKTRDLDSNLDLISDSPSYVRYQQERVHLHETRCTSHAQRKKVIDLMLCLGLKDEAVRLLLETEPDDPNYYEDNLKACLVASTAVSEKDTPHSTTKLVATNLIAEGKIWEGVQLLCLINKVPEACVYLQSYNQWDASLWLAKCRLPDSEYRKVAEKYTEHCLHKDFKRHAVLVRLAMGDLVGTLDALVAAKMVPLASQFLQAAQELKLLPDTSHMMVLVEEISLAYARMLFDCGSTQGAFYYCERADEKGEILRREMEILMQSTPIKEVKESIE